MICVVLNLDYNDVIFASCRCSILVNDSVRIYLKVVDRAPTGDTSKLLVALPSTPDDASSLL